jgi:hypothetical protein
VASTLLANGYLHYAFDLWVQHWRQHRATGEMIVVRYADDAVLGFQHRADAEQFLRDWKERLGRFGLELHPDKTRLIEFGRYAVANRKERGEGKPETFNFLGFTTSVGKRGRPANSSFYADHPQAALCQIESAEGGASKRQTSVRGEAREMVEVRCTGILQLSCRPRESGQPSKFSVAGASVLDARATATQPEESDDLATTRGYSRALAPQT